MIDHVEGCKLERALNMSVGIECQHGFDVCAECDPCTCPSEIKEAREASFLLHQLDPEPSPVDQIKNALTASMNQFLKKPNTLGTRQRIRLAVQEHLETLSRKGVLAKYDVAPVPGDGDSVTIEAKLQFEHHGHTHVLRLGWGKEPI